MKIWVVTSAWVVNDTWANGTALKAFTNQAAADAFLAEINAAKDPVIDSDTVTVVTEVDLVD